MLEQHGKARDRLLDSPLLAEAARRDRHRQGDQPDRRQEKKPAGNSQRDQFRSSGESRNALQRGRALLQRIVPGNLPPGHQIQRVDV